VCGRRRDRRPWDAEEQSSPGDPEAQKTTAKRFRHTLVRSEKRVDFCPEPGMFQENEKGSLEEHEAGSNRKGEPLRLTIQHRQSGQ
jgi:hypothetical protein